MINIEQLSKQLTHDEYEEGRDLYNLLRERGIPSSKAAGMVFRSGRLNSRQDAKETDKKLRVEIGRLQGIIAELRKSQPEANAATDPGNCEPGETEEGVVENE